MSLLYRCIYSDREARRHKSKLITPNDVQGKYLAIDGYNTLITVESILKDKLVILCDDGLVRDISEVHNKYKSSKWTIRALETMARILSNFKVKEAKVFFDRQISRSGELAALTRNIFNEAKIIGDAETYKKSDVHTLKWSKYVATSDAVIINKAKGIFDIPANIIKKKSKNFLDTTEF